MTNKLQNGYLQQYLLCKVKNKNNTILRNILKEGYFKLIGYSKKGIRIGHIIKENGGNGGQCY